MYKYLINLTRLDVKVLCRIDPSGSTELQRRQRQGSRKRIELEDAPLLYVLLMKVLCTDFVADKPRNC